MQASQRSQYLETSLILKNVILSRRPNFTLPFPIGNSKTINIPISNLIYVESDGVLSKFYMKNFIRNMVSITASIGECERELRQFAFIRSHRSFLINSSYISSVELDREGTIFLSDGMQLPLSRRRIKETNAHLISLGFAHLLEH